MPTFHGSDQTQLYSDELESASGSSSALPLIVLAGGAARFPSYLGDLAGLSSTRRLIVPHLRGVGNSPMPDRADVASFWQQATDIEALRVELGLEQALLVVHSAGTESRSATRRSIRQRLLPWCS